MEMYEYAVRHENLS